jgi:multidrug transporter EmrE-like cation transporter
MISPYYVGCAFLAGILQAVAIWLMRSKGLAFWQVVPLVLAHQSLFMPAYSGAPNFIGQWYLTMAVTAGLSLALGLFVFKDPVSLSNAVGLCLVLAGVALLKG